MFLKTSSKFSWPLMPIFSVFFVFLPQIVFAAEALPSEGTAWWVWVILLFVFSFFLGIVAVVAGVGGGVLYVPIVSSLFPFLSFTAVTFLFNYKTRHNWSSFTEYLQTMPAIYKAIGSM